MSRDRYVTRYSNHFELADGQDLEVRYWAKHICASHPENDCGEPAFYIEGISVTREELPPEVTAEVIAELVDNAKRDWRDCDDNVD